MKKTFTLIALFALVTTSVFANNYTFSWAHTLDGNTAAADNAVEVSKSADGHILVLNSWGSASYRLPNLCTSMWMGCWRKTTVETKLSVLITKQAMAPR